jgi:hypothetical protein
MVEKWFNLDSRSQAPLRAARTMLSIKFRNEGVNVYEEVGTLHGIGKIWHLHLGKGHILHLLICNDDLKVKRSNGVGIPFLYWLEYSILLYLVKISPDDWKLDSSRKNLACFDLRYRPSRQHEKGVKRNKRG